MRLPYALLVATALLLAGAMAFATPQAEAQVGTSTLTVHACAAEDQRYWIMYEGDASTTRACAGPLPNATIRITAPGPLNSSVGGVDRTATTDADGSATFTQIPDGTYTVVASRANFASDTVRAEVKEAGKAQVVLDGSSLTQAGRVVGPAGQAVAGAYVSICCTDTDSGAVVTGTDGSFRIATKAGYRNVQVHGASGYEDRYDYRLVDGKELRIELTPLPPPDAHIQGTVRDQDGNPLGGIRIDAYSYGGPVPYATTTDKPEGGSGQSQGSPGMADAPSTMPYRYGGGNHTTTAADGTYRIGVFAGQVGLNINQEGYASRSLQLQVDQGATVTQDIRLLKFPEKTAQVSGRITDATTGDGLRAAYVQLRSPLYGIHECSDNGMQPGVDHAQTEPAVMPIREPDRMECAIRVNADGTFTGRVTPGYTILEVGYQSWMSCKADGTGCGPEYFSYTRTLDLPADATTRLDVALAPRPGPDAILSGYVVDGETGTPIVDANIWFWNQDNSAYGQAVTDKDGSYKVRLRSGLTTISVNVWRNDGAGGYLPWQGMLDVRPGETPFDVTLTPGEESGHCCYLYESAPAAMGMDSSAKGPSGVSSSPGGMPGGSGLVSNDMSREDGQGGQARGFEDLKGGLGPYDASAREQVLQDAESPGVPMPFLLAALAGLVLAARRRLR